MLKYFCFEKEAVLVEYEGKFSSVIVPATHEGLPVVGIAAAAFEGNPDLREVQLPNTIQFVGTRAFYGCSRLATINGQPGCTVSILPERCAVIGNLAFAGTALQDLIVFGDVEVGRRAFSCSGIKNALFLGDKVSLAAEAFHNSDLESIEIAAKLDLVPTRCFYNCRKLINVSMTVEELAEGAFENCAELRSLELRGLARMLYKGVFRGCDKLHTLTLPATLTHLDIHALEGSSLGYIRVDPENPEYSDHHGILLDKQQKLVLFCPPGLEEVQLPATVCAIGPRAFARSQIVDFRLPEGVTAVGGDAFYGCDQLTRLELPESKLDLSVFDAPLQEIYYRGSKKSFLENVSLGRHEGRASVYIEDESGDFAELGCWKENTFFEFIETNNSVKITRIKKVAPTVTIPPVINGKQVKELGADAVPPGIRCLILPDTMERSEPDAFRLASDLESLTQD